MNFPSFNKKLFRFLASSPTAFHAVDNIANLLEKSGFLQLNEDQQWHVVPEQPYFLVRENGALIAFCHGGNSDGFRILGAHSDSPALQLKPQPDIFENSYHKWGVEVYGGPLLAPWFDRELGLAGRVVCKTGANRLSVHLINIDKPCAIIPSMAIHLDRDANKERSINAQNDIIPVIGLATTSAISIRELLAEELDKQGVSSDANDILSFDLFLYDFHRPTYVGIRGEFILASRLDNLVSSFVAASSILDAPRNANYIFICNNHEEVGSNTASGAQGNLLLSLLERIIPEKEERFRRLARSFLISMDNAHATHPNFADKHDTHHEILLNHGPVLKVNAQHRYASTALSTALFRQLCDEAGIKMQEFVMRNDMACGSTIGPLTAAKLGLKTVDVGVASLGMHSVRELTGAKDPKLLFSVIKHFLNRHDLPEILS